MLHVCMVGGTVFGLLYGEVRKSAYLTSSKETCSCYDTKARFCYFAPARARSSETGRSEGSNFNSKANHQIPQSGESSTTWSARMHPRTWGALSYWAGNILINNLLLENNGTQKLRNTLLQKQATSMLISLLASNCVAGMQCNNAAFDDSALDMNVRVVHHVINLVVVCMDIHIF